MTPRLSPLAIPFALAIAACSGTSSSNGGAVPWFDAGADGASPAASGATGGGGSNGGGGGGGGGGSSGTGTTNPPATSTSSTYGDVHTGKADLGPVEWNGSIHNACSPYPQEIQTAEGDYLVGLDNKYNNDGHLCDACVIVNAASKSVVARVVTYGQASSTENMDVSPAMYKELGGAGNEIPITWQLAKCPDTGKIYYQFQTGSNSDWTSFWVRNARVPIDKIEVKSARHKDWFALKHAANYGDGTLTDAGGFGMGAWQIRLTGIDGQQVTDSFASFQEGGALLPSTGQFQ